MTAFARINPDTYYVNGVPIPASYFQAVDSAQTAGLDGDAGNDTWSPSSPIIVGGAGVWCAGPWLLTGNTPMVQLAAAAPLVHGDSDYIQLASGHAMATRFLVTSCALGKDASGCSTLSTNQPVVVAGPTAVMLAFNFINGFGVVNSLQAQPFREGGRLVMPLHVHNGAPLVEVIFNFTIEGTSTSGPTRTAVPTILPQFRVHKVDIAGNLTPLYTGAGQLNGFRQLVNSPNTAANYMAITQFVYGCDSGTVIDTSTYVYIAEIVDESGSNCMAGNQYLNATCLFTPIADMRPQ